MSKHSAWKDKAIAMKLEGVPMRMIADEFGVSRGVVMYATKGVKSAVPVRMKASVRRYTEAAGFEKSHYKTRIAIGFPTEVFNSINAFARSSNKSFSSVVVDLTSKALSDLHGGAS